MGRTSAYLNRRKKAQVTTIDLIISISMFVAMLTILYGAWNSKIQQESSQIENFQASIAAQNAITSITESPGFPTNWAAENLSPNSDSLKGIGTAYAHGEIDWHKLAALSYYYNYAPTNNQSRIKMGISPFNASINVSYANGTQIALLGSLPSASDEILYALRKPAAYNSSAAVVAVRVWR